MAVYVDDMDISYQPAGGRRRLVMSHMVADTEKELEEMARRLKLRPEWIQRGTITHYDICKSKKAEAIAAGAIQITKREVVEKFILGRKS